MLWVLNPQHTHWRRMDPKALAVELRKAGVQPKIVQRLRARCDYFFAVARRHPQETARADKVVAIASRFWS